MLILPRTLLSLLVLAVILVLSGCTPEDAAPTALMEHAVFSHSSRAGPVSALDNLNSLTNE